MLQTVDVLIGFSLVMLVLSVVVTMLVQFVVSMLLNLKGRVLHQGVAHLLNLLDKDGLTGDETHQIARHILSNALIARKRVFGGFIGKEFALAQTIHREELIKLVLDFAGNCDLEKANAVAQLDLTLGQYKTLINAESTTKEVDGQLAKLRELFTERKLEELMLLQARLHSSLRNNGLTQEPKVVIRGIREKILELEISSPAMASDVRQTIAIATHAPKEFVAKINAWFDQTIDRTVESYTGKTRAWTTGFALVVALFFQVDTFELIQRLSVDKETRQMLVDAATSHPEKFEALATLQRQEAEATLSEAQAAKANADKLLAAAPDVGKKQSAQIGLTAAQAELAKATEALAALPPRREPDKQAQADLDTARKQLAVVGNERARAAAQQAVVAAQKRLETSAATPFSQRDALAAIDNNPDLKKLIDAELIARPVGIADWLKGWPEPGFGLLVHLIGIVVTMGLLTLGAPVWYEVLKNLIQFRSLVSRKDDVIRATRQTSQISQKPG